MKKVVVLLAIITCSLQAWSQDTVFYQPWKIGSEDLKYCSKQITYLVSVDSITMNLEVTSLDGTTVWEYRIRPELTKPLYEQVTLWYIDTTELRYIKRVAKDRYFQIGTIYLFQLNLDNLEAGEYFLRIKQGYRELNERKKLLVRH